jgi:hypothetical protein
LLGDQLLNLPAGSGHGPKKGSYYLCISHAILFYLSYILPPSSPMKISRKIQQSANNDKVWWSFEYFPPRTAQVIFPPILCSLFPNSLQGLQNLLDRIERMRALGPEFIDVTWSACAPYSLFIRLISIGTTAGMQGAEPLI